jgi:hypothetical protein
MAHRSALLACATAGDVASAGGVLIGNIEDQGAVRRVADAGTGVLIGDRLIMFGYTWLAVLDGDARARDLFNRHYSRRHYSDNRRRTIFVGPGEKMVLLTETCDALFVWRKFISGDGQNGINCAIFRNESNRLSSWLIEEAEVLARQRWPGQRLYTYINPRKIKSSNPGFCFLKNGWRKCGTSKSGLIILEKIP